MERSATKHFVQVNAEDQKLINRFARLHQQSVELQECINATELELQNLNDAFDEALLMDDEDLSGVPYKCGLVYLHLDQKTLNERMEKSKKELEDKTTELSMALSEITEELSTLKAVLYGKFGDSINLETDTDS